MARYSKQHIEEHKNRIRSVLVVNPGASLRTIQETLENSEENPLHLHIDYISKLRKKIIKERAHRNDRLLVGTRIAEMQDKKARIDQMLWREASDKTNSGKVRVTALVSLLKAELDLLNAELDSGIFQRKLGSIHMTKTLELKTEQKVLIVKAFRNFGLVDDTIIKTIKPPAATANRPGGGTDS